MAKPGVIEADIVIVGAGAAGSVLANRLSAQTSISVLLIEAGGTDRHPLIQMPAGFFHLLSHRGLNWRYVTDGEEGTDGRSLNYPRGKVLGGSSSINGMWQSWGLPSDYDAWAANGCTGWSFADVKPYFLKSERYEGPGGGDRGRDGPIAVNQFTTHNPWTREFLRSGEALQLPVIADYNSDPREGVSLVQQTRSGRFRMSAARAYLRPAMRRPNLRVETGAQVSSIEIAHRRAVGVRFRKHGQDVLARARREVVLAAGAINSPHLLQLSGIGSAEELQALGIPVVLDSPGVGRNLHDHYVARVTRQVVGQETLNEESRGLGLLRALFQYAFFGTGLMTYSAGNATGFIRSAPDLAVPDLQLVFTPGSYSPTRAGKLDVVPAVTCGVWQMRPESRGSVMARSKDPHVPPSIRPGYLQAEVDRKAVVAGLRFCRRILDSPAFSTGGREIVPGATILAEEDLLDYARRTGSTVFHPVGSCRMGDDGEAVVHSDLKVRGIDGLRVIDASVMPTITSSNTHAPTVMIAEKGADLILEDLRRAGTG